ncbi:hypothetical protein CRG98_016417 [Punica granatum]|uniref:Uncharacterized protein n=1 Tax=Punica granatum TaxID=22663 RepID=A0A2I0K3W3_PUNGR|nr:hypothetical protein CRG98_016417 [Punica granatum]
MDRHLLPLSLYVWVICCLFLLLPLPPLETDQIGRGERREMNVETTQHERRFQKLQKQTRPGGKRPLSPLPLPLRRVARGANSLLVILARHDQNAPEGELSS